ncbi:MAG TPA: hypothetical protein VGP43_03750 [Chitinophagaceae bacterium]|nr:hypothetical protein [Chitinophagaceae bacterium]
MINIKTVTPKPLKGSLLQSNIFLNFEKSKASPVDELPSRIKKNSIKNGLINMSDTFPKARLLYNTDRGKIYSLPLDNMRCLVPDEMYTINENKHYRQYYPPSSIPNPFRKYDIVSGEQHGKISGIHIIPSPNK